MKGRTMYVIPYSMGVVGSPFSRIGIEVTDSIYVVLNMEIMTRVGKVCLDELGENGDFVKGFHCKCDVDPEKRYILHFPEDNTIIPSTPLTAATCCWARSASRSVSRRISASRKAGWPSIC